MLSHYVRIMLYLSSYFPLFAILMIRHYEQEEIFYVLLPVIGFVSLTLWKTFSTLSTVGGVYVKNGKIEDTGKMILQYFLTYIIPFLVVDFFEWQNLVTYGIIFFIIGVLYVKSDLIYMNPTLVLLRFNIFKVVTEDDEFVIISKCDKKDLLKNPVIKIGQGVYYGKEYKGNTNYEENKTHSG